jgi:hypothetical protein
MDFEMMSLEELFAAADVIPDHREYIEKAELQQQLAEALAELAEAIGVDEN